MQSTPWGMSLQCIKLDRSNPYFFDGKLVPIETGHPMDPTQGWQRGMMASQRDFVRLMMSWKTRTSDTGRD